jgi:hypothetical protein
MLNALNLTKHPRMRRHKSFVSVGSASQKNLQNRFVPVYEYVTPVYLHSDGTWYEFLMAYWLSIEIFLLFSSVLLAHDADISTFKEIIIVSFHILT